MAISELIFCRKMESDIITDNNKGNDRMIKSKILEKISKELKTSGKFIKSTADFSFELFQKTVKQKESIIISPVSVLVAMTMTANGADTQTRQEMQQVLGGDSLEELNVELKQFLTDLYSGEKAVLKRADSIWFKNTEGEFTVNRDFLNLISDTFHAELFQVPFDSQTREKINSWVSGNTEGRIENFLKILRSDVWMYLIDICTLDAEWANIYEQHEISEGIFTAYNNKKQTAFMMHSTENCYLKDDITTGFLKPYAKGYSFVALLPKEGMDINEYVESLSGEYFLHLLNNVKHMMVLAELPKFQGKSSLELGEILQKMGIKKAFSREADLSRLGKSEKNSLYISRVFQDSYIEIDERGTKAGAATAVELSRCAMIADKVKLNRPFVYAVVDNQTKLPLFLGTVLSI